MNLRGNSFRCLRAQARRSRFSRLVSGLNKRALILVHRQELLEQTRDKALLVGYSTEEVSCITSSSKEKMRRLTIAMVPTLIKNLSLYGSDEIEMMVVDEAHHSLAASYITILRHFGMLEGEKLLLGFTATPLRGDGKSLGAIYSSHSFKMTLSEATQQGYICPVHGLRINFSYNIAKIESKGGDYEPGELDKLINCEELNTLVADKCESLMRLPAIVFCTSVNHAENICRKLEEKEKRAGVVSYLKSKAANAETLRKLRNREIDYVLNAVKLTEGFDHPPIQSIVLARPTRSPALYKQMIGRGLRLSPNKYDCLVMEFAGNDPKMISWDQIDSTASFQSFARGDLIKREKAFQHYKSKFTSVHVKVLDVRVSPFSFYDCKIQRMKRYRKDFLFIPHDDGFIVGALIPFMDTNRRGMIWNARRMVNYILFWKEKYKSFTCFSAGEMWKSSCGWQQRECEKQLKFYADKALTNNDPDAPPLGKWYPSEEEGISPWQKSQLPSGTYASARKAEMMIEDKAIIRAINKFWRDRPFPILKEDKDGCIVDKKVFVI